jgi:hypothetical protein
MSKLLKIGAVALVALVGGATAASAHTYDGDGCPHGKHGHHHDHDHKHDHDHDWDDDHWWDDDVHDVDVTVTDVDTDVRNFTSTLVVL